MACLYGITIDLHKGRLALEQAESQVILLGAFDFFVSPGGDDVSLLKVLNVFH